MKAWLEKWSRVLGCAIFLAIGASVIISALIGIVKFMNG